MTEKNDQPKQKTPKGHEIPVRSRDETLRGFRKIARPVAPVAQRPRPQ